MRSSTSGSTAALAISVTPDASVPAITSCSVAPTDGNGNSIRVPRSRSAVTVTDDDVSSTFAPRARRPLRWKSIGRAPIEQPPGSGTTARPSRPTSGPSTRNDARIFRTEYALASGERGPSSEMTTLDPFRTTRFRSDPSVNRIMLTSRSWGTRWMTTASSVRRDATHAGRAAFLAPSIAIRPVSLRPPSMERTSMG